MKLPTTLGRLIPSQRPHNGKALVRHLCARHLQRILFPGLCCVGPRLPGPSLPGPQLNSLGEAWGGTSMGGTM